MAEQTIAIAQFVVLGGVFGALLGVFRTERNVDRLPRIGLGCGLLLALVFGSIEVYLGFAVENPLLALLWQGAVFGAWGLLLGWLLRATAWTQAREADTDGSRRQVLAVGVTGLAAAVAGAIGLGLFLSRPRQGNRIAVEPTPAGSLTSGAAASPGDEELAGRIEPAPGTRPEVTPNESFYRIDINTRPPDLAPNDWQLEIAGMVNTPTTLTLEQIRSRPSVSQYLTLSCISNRVGGDLIGTSLWTGIRLKDLLTDLGLQPDARSLVIEAADGFHETVVLDDLMDERTLLVYAMNGMPLPQEHGFPLRIYIPNRYGMKQPKWIVRMEAVDNTPAGYWVERGWSRTAIMRTTSIIDTVTVEKSENSRIVVGGIAHAGARGISKVEVQIDDGPWQEARLRIPPLSMLTWVQWRHVETVPAGAHTARVRAYDGDGEMQTLVPNSPHPDGATGVHTMTFEV